MSKGYSADDLLDAIKQIENESVRKVLGALWMFETGDSPLAYKDFYRTQLELGADIAEDSRGSDI
jgi:hypothetical protein